MPLPSLLTTMSVDVFHDRAEAPVALVEADVAMFVETEADEDRHEIVRRHQIYRDGRSMLDIARRTVIIVGLRAGCSPVPVSAPPTSPGFVTSTRARG